MRVFAVYFLALGKLDTEKEALMEALMKQVKTKHPWLICDANMNPKEFKNSLWFENRHMFLGASREGLSTCRSKKTEWRVD